MGMSFIDFIQTLSYEALYRIPQHVAGRRRLGIASRRQRRLHGAIGFHRCARISTRQRWADVTLYLKDGRGIQSEPNTPKGDPEDPLSDLEISAKFHLLANPVIGEKRAADIEERICQVDDSDFELENLTRLVLAPVE
jgi:hypothetical protein